MAHAYTPGLKVLAQTVLTKERRLPLPGDILVNKNDKVAGEEVVARTNLPGNVQTLNVAGLLGILPDEVEEAMLKKAGDTIEKDEVLAQSKGIFGLFKSHVKSPIKGVIESVSKITGQLILREPPIPVEVIAYIDGQVIEILVNITNSSGLMGGINGSTINVTGNFTQMGGPAVRKATWNATGDLLFVLNYTINASTIPNWNSQVAGGAVDVNIHNITGSPFYLLPNGSFSPSPGFIPIFVAMVVVNPLNFRHML